MANMTIPTSRDIYLELNGKKLAVVQGYSAKALRTSREVEAFGESEPVATVSGEIERDARRYDGGFYLY